MSFTASKRIKRLLHRRNALRHWQQLGDFGFAENEYLHFVGLGQLKCDSKIGVGQRRTSATLKECALATCRDWASLTVG